MHKEHCRKTHLLGHRHRLQPNNGISRNADTKYGLLDLLNDKRQHCSERMRKLNPYLLASATSWHEQTAAHVQHLAGGLQLRARDLDAFGQKRQHKWRAARELKGAVTPSQPKLAAWASFTILQPIVK